MACIPWELLWPAMVGQSTTSIPFGFSVKISSAIYDSCAFNVNFQEAQAGANRGNMQRKGLER